MHARCYALLLPLLLLACQGSPPEAPSQAPGGRAARSPQNAPEAESSRKLAQAFVQALNKPAPNRAASLIAWDLYAQRDSHFKALMEDLKERLAEHQDARTLDHPLLPGSSITRRQLLMTQDENALLGSLLRQRFQRQAARNFSLQRRKNKARMVLFDADPSASLTTILMPDGHLADFKLIWHQGHLQLLPLF